MSFSIDSVRTQFPALAREHNGHKVAYFDGPGGTQVPRRVVEAMQDYLYHHNANSHWAFPSSAETDAALLAARETFADFLNAAADEIVFGPNMTSLTFHLARGLGRGWNEGDEIVVTELDHHANIAPWVDVAAERGLEVRWAPVNPETGFLDMEALVGLLGKRTKMLAIGAASNALGTVTDVGTAIQAARAVGAMTFVDAVHAAPHCVLDVRAWGCDFLACSPYKFYGPHSGVLFGRNDLLQAVRVPKLAPAPDQAPERLETGTQNHEGIVGGAAAVEFIASLGSGSTRRERIESAQHRLHEVGLELLTRLWEGLAAIPGVRLYGPSPGEPRTSTLAFTVGAHDSADVARQLAESDGVFVSHGDFYATTVVDRLGLAEQGLVRAGCACYTSEEEVDRLIRGVRRFALATQAGVGPS